MFVIPGRAGKDMCDGFGRRELLRIGGSSLLGLAGGASILLGVLILLWPSTSAFVIVVLLRVVLFPSFE